MSFRASGFQTILITCNHIVEAQPGSPQFLVFGWQNSFQVSSPCPQPQASTITGLFSILGFQITKFYKVVSLSPYLLVIYDLFTVISLVKSILPISTCSYGKYNPFDGIPCLGTHHASHPPQKSCLYSVLFKIKFYKCSVVSWIGSWSRTWTLVGKVVKSK